MELADYLFHRAQHAWPSLWAMHSLHHSDSTLGITTSVRHFWAESLIRTAIVYPPITIMLNPGPLLVAIYGVAVL